MAGATNDYLPFATGTGALLEDQPTYLADARRAQGVAPGIGDPALANKTWRQASVMASMLGQFMCNVLQQNVPDDGDVGGRLTQFEAALSVFAGAPGPASLVHGGYDTGTANALQVSAVPVIAALRAFMVLEVSPAVTSVDATAQNPATLTLNNTGTGSTVTAPIVRMDGSPIRKGDLVGGQNPQLKQLISDGTKWYLVGNNMAKSWGGVDTGTADAMVVTTNPSFAFMVDGQELHFIKGAQPNATTTPTVAPNGITPAPTIVRCDGTAVAAADLPANTLLPTEYVAANNTLRLLWPVTPTQVPKILAPNTVFYIRPNGNDANSGMANTDAAAFATIQGAVNYVARNFVGGNQVTLQLGVTGTYAAPLSVSNGNFIIIGDPANPGNFTISGVGNSVGGCVTLVTSGSLQTNGLTVQNTGPYYTFGAIFGGNITTNNTAFTTTGQTNTAAHLFAEPGGTITIQAGCTFAGNIGNEWIATGGTITQGANVSVLGNPTLRTFAYATGLGQIRVVSGYSISGTATGSRYAVDTNSLIIVSGGGANYFPGTTAGTFASGGQYVP